MFVTELLVAVGIALLLTAVFTAAFDRTGPWTGFWVFFLVILLVSWVAGLWARPFGPALFGVYWAPYLAFGLIAALLIAAATPPNRPDAARRRDATRGREVDPAASPGAEDRAVRRADGPGRTEEDVAVEGAVVALGVFFWILVLVLLTAVVLGYL